MGANMSLEGGDRLYENPLRAAAVNFEVEKLLAQRVCGTSREVLVQWAGYGPACNSWEPLANMPARVIALHLPSA